MFKLYMGLFLAINIYAGTQYTNDKVEITNSKKDKVFTREYTYNASDDDSKNSAREKALSQLKALLSEEVGTHIQSSLDMKNTIKNGIKTEYVKSEINSLSAAIIKLKILSEKWDGKTYYVKADVKLNEEETMNLLLEAIKDKASEKDIKRLNKILNEQNKNLDKSYEKIQQLQKKLVLQEIQNKASISELKDTKIKLQLLQKEKIHYDNQVIKQKNEIVRIKKLIDTAKKRINKENKKACLLESGMTKQEVIDALGSPTGLEDYSCKGATNGIYYPLKGNCTNWYYGTVKLIFGKNKILQTKSGCY